jgi:hypothetical protein
VTASAAPGRDEWDRDACDDQTDDNPMHIAAYALRAHYLGDWGPEPIESRVSIDSEQMF